MAAACASQATALELEVIATCVIFAEVDAVATVKTPVDAEDPPIGVPSIAPPLTSMVVKLADPVEVKVPPTV